MGKGCRERGTHRWHVPARAGGTGRCWSWPLPPSLVPSLPQDTPLLLRRCHVQCRRRRGHVCAPILPPPGTQRSGVGCHNPRPRRADASPPRADWSAKCFQESYSSRRRERDPDAWRTFRSPNSFWKWKGIKSSKTLAALSPNAARAAGPGTYRKHRVVRKVGRRSAPGKGRSTVWCHGRRYCHRHSWGGHNRQMAQGEKEAAGFGSCLRRWHRGAGDSPGPPTVARGGSGLSEKGSGAALAPRDCCFTPRGGGGGGSEAVAGAFWGPAAPEVKAGR